MQRLLRELVARHEWDKVFMLYLGGGGMQRFSVGEGGLATGCRAACVPIELLVNSKNEKYNQLVLALLENGACANGLGRRNKPPLALAVDAEQYQLAVALLQHNANPTCLASNEGETPLIEALRLAFTKGRATFFAS